MTDLELMKLKLLYLDSNTVFSHQIRAVIEEALARGGRMTKLIAAMQRSQRGFQNMARSTPHGQEAATQSAIANTLSDFIRLAAELRAGDGERADVTELETFKAMLDRQKVEYHEDKEGRMKDGTVVNVDENIVITIKADTSRVQSGYYGFFQLWHFTPEGRFIMTGTWE